MKEPTMLRRHRILKGFHSRYRGLTEAQALAEMWLDMEAMDAHHLTLLSYLVGAVAEQQDEAEELARRPGTGGLVTLSADLVALRHDENCLQQGEWETDQEGEKTGDDSRPFSIDAGQFLS